MICELGAHPKPVENLMENQSYMKLSKRLQTIADLIENGASVADVGTDHGYLPVFLAQKGNAKKIIASDINEAPLAVACRSATAAGVSDKISFVVAPGLDCVAPEDVDTIVIAGMGGEMIVSILKAAPWTKSDRKKLILQPQSKLDILFRFLYNEGYKIKLIKQVPDKNKRYTIILIS